MNAKPNSQPRRFHYSASLPLALSLTAILAPALPLSADSLTIINGNFNTGTAGDSSFTPITGWTDAGASAGFWLADDNSPGSSQDPTEGQAPPVEAGESNLFLSANRLAGGAGSQPSSSTLSQTLTIDPTNLAIVQGGEGNITLSFYYFDSDNNDSGTITLTFLDSGSTEIGSISTGALPNSAPNATSYNSATAPWTQQALSGAVPSATESIRLDIITNPRLGGSATNVFFDSFSAQIGLADSDNDGLPDSYEQSIIDADPGDLVADLSDVAGPNDAPTVTDFDEDGLSDADELNFTDPLNPDTDDDGLDDGPEVNGTDNLGTSHGFGPTDPLEEDSDLDTLLDGPEVAGTDNDGLSHGFGATDPNSGFSDADFLDDAWEIQFGLNPNDDTGDNGNTGDPDMDGLDNLGEFDNLADPTNPDTDGDGLRDGPEVDGTDNSSSSHGFGPTLPDSSDTDEDGFGDLIEILLASDPNDPGSNPGTQVTFVNGGFESPAVTPSGAAIGVAGNTVPGWTAIENDFYITDTFTGAAIDAGNPNVANEGTQFATAERRAPDPDIAASALIGGIDAAMGMRQDLDVSSLAASIDAGTRTLAVTFDFFDNDVFDNGIVELDFLDASDSNLGRHVSFLTDSVPESQEWKTRSIFGYPPAGTRTVRVTVSVVKAVANGTSARNVHFDNFRGSLFFLDLDSDLMADDWEIANGLNPSSGSDAGNQDDADSLTNLQEFLAGTDPNNEDTDADGSSDSDELAAGSDPLNANSFPVGAPLVVTAAGFNGSNEFEVTVTGLNPTKTYRMVRGTDLLNFPDEVDSQLAGGESDTFTDPTPPTGNAFYRVEEVITAP